MCLDGFRHCSSHVRLFVEAELFALGSSGLTRLGEIDHLDSNHTLAADCIHVSGILPSLLDPWHVPDALGFLPDCFSNEGRKFLIIVAIPEDWFQIVIFCVKEA